MSRLFSGCIRSPRRKHGVREEEPEKEIKTETKQIPRPPLGMKNKVLPFGLKPPERNLSLRQVAMHRNRKAHMTEQHAAQKAQPELNIFRGINLPRRNPQGPILQPDSFVGIPEVFGISKTDENKNELFHEFLDHKEAAMVFFYDPRTAASNKAKLRVQQAARTTKRPNHAYVAISCPELPGICLGEKVRSMPTFKLYSYGQFVGHYEDSLTTAADLKVYTETSPVADLPRENPPPCAIQ